MSARRPHAQHGIAELERLASAPGTSFAIKRAIQVELGHRNTMRAAALRQSLADQLAGSQASPLPSEPHKGSSPTVPAAGSRAAPSRGASRTTGPTGQAGLRPASAAPEPVAKIVKQIGRAASPFNDPGNIIRAWTVLEVLSPAAFRKPADLAGGDMRRIARFERGLPWDDGLAKGPPGKRLYFQIVLGTLPMQPAYAQLLERFSDARPERPNARGETPLAVVTVDRDGRPIEDKCAVISSFGWGLPKALSGDPATLGDWAEVGHLVERKLHDLLYREGADGKVRPLDLAAIDAAYRWLVKDFGLDPTATRPPAFAVRTPVPMRQNEPPEPLLLNSFYLEDLAAAGKLLRDGKAPDTLKRFLGALSPGERADLFSDERAIEESVAPARFPLGRWPELERHPLVLMQQAAVNLALEQAPGEILGVNGPPGTGKTTLLRDVVAGLVSQRAAVMALYDDPEKAFSNSGERLNMGGARIHLYKLDDRLRGFEMLIASSNNKAVENVSRELPALSAIAEDAAELRYFQPMSDSLIEGESWGAIAAVLGNASNRYQFKNQFWWAEDTGLFSYFKALDGRRPETDDGTGAKRPPRIVSELNPPVDRRSALSRWQTARRRFREIFDEVEMLRASVELLRQRSRLLPLIERTFAAIRAHGAQRPVWFARLLRLRSARDWQAVHRPLADAFSAAVHAADRAKLLTPGDRRLRLSRSPWLGFGADAKAADFESALEPLLDALRSELSSRAAQPVDDTLFERGRDEIQQAAPWFTSEEHRHRDALFVAAMDLHRAFIDAAAKPLRHNLGAALQVLDGKGLGTPGKDALIPDLWSSLFLVVPALSTTFASVRTMLGRLPACSIGWLLIDEAGQAAPQQAVGAIMRANRAIVVGDPIQVPPVVMLPDTLTAAICETFGVDPVRFAAPSASVQTLADDATRWFAEFHAGIGSRMVGVPLLVHRRCSGPMFEIANSVAYENQMVQAKRPKESPIRDLLGASRWLHVVGTGSDKWCPEEGDVVLDLVERLLSGGVEPDLYVVTPFVQVADGLRRVLRDSRVLAANVNDIDRWVFDRVGTIHTVQGREAEAVIFVLGAPNVDQRGARAWAGSDPNLLNVAVTRAKEALYVVGNRDLWRSAGVFAALDREIR